MNSRRFSTITRPRVLWLLFAAALLLVFAPLLRSMEQVLGLAALFQWRGHRAAPDDITLVTISPTSSQRLGLPQHSSAWPRTVYIDLIDRLREMDARLIVLDIAFREARDDATDKALGEAMANAGNVLLFKYLQRRQINAGTTLVDLQMEQPPIPVLARNALGVGAFVLPKFPSSVTHAPLFLHLGGGIEPSLPLLAYLTLLDRSWLEQIWHEVLKQSAPLALQPAQSARQIYHVMQQQPALAQLPPAEREFLELFERHPAAAINYYGPAGSFRTVAIQDVVGDDRSSLTDAVKDKIVYVGFATNVQTEQRDAYRTVFSDRYGVDLSGVEISATVLGNLLDNSTIHNLSPRYLYLSGVLALLAAVYCFRLPAIPNAAAQMGALLAYLATACICFKWLHVWWPVATPVTVLLATDAVLLARRYTQHKHHIAQINHALGQYLPPDAARELGSNISALEKRHRLVHGVCLLTDIQGYTKLSEELPPQELHQLMNDYYGLLVRIIHERGGIVGNIVGDSLLALWTGPRITQEMCEAAVCGAADILGCIRDHPDFSHRLPTCIGLHGGQFSLGNLGAQGHFEYSPVGDIINTASRVEHLNRSLGTKLLCTDQLAPSLATYFAGRKTQLRPLGKFILRNRVSPTGLYTLSDNRSLDQQFAQALELYNNQQHLDALHRFVEIAQHYDDGPSRYYLARCQSALNITKEHSHADIRP